MFCKWCGLESETSDVCSWCNRPFSAAATAQQKSAPPPAAESASVESAPVAAPPNMRVPAVPQAKPGAVPLGDFDDLYDDFSPSPFAGSSMFSGRSAPAPPVPPARPTTAPDYSPPAPKPPPATAAPGSRVDMSPAPKSAPPPVSPGRGGPGYTPATARQADDDRPQLEAIPIKRPGGSAGPP